jgi:hypothetical protein
MTFLELLTYGLFLGFLVFIAIVGALGMGWVGTALSHFYGGRFDAFQGAILFGISFGLIVLAVGHGTIAVSRGDSSPFDDDDHKNF